MKQLPALICVLVAACGSGDPNHQGNQNGMQRSDGAVAPMIAIEAGISVSHFVVEINSVDLGDVYQHNKFPLEFPFSIQGSDGIVITRLTTSCGCTDARLEVNGVDWALGEEIPAGSMGVIHAIFDSRAYNGTKTSSITIDGNSSDFPMRLSLTSQVKPVFATTPHMARFAGILSGSLRRNQNPQRTLEVLGSEPWEISRWVDLPDWVTIVDSGENTVAPDGVGEIHKLVVSLDPDIAEGRYSALAVAETNIGHQLSFQVYAELYGKVRYFPNRLVGFNLVEQGNDPERRLQIKASVDWLELPIPDIIYEGADVFDVILDEKTPAKEYVIIVQLRPEAEIGRHSGKVKVTWPASSAIPDREFPISVLVRAPR